MQACVSIVNVNIRALVGRATSPCEARAQPRARVGHRAARLWQDIHVLEEAVIHAQAARELRVDAGVAQQLHVTLALVAQHVEFRGLHQRRRQIRERRRPQW